MLFFMQKTRGHNARALKKKENPGVTVVRVRILPAIAGGSPPEYITSPLAVTEVKGGMCAVAGDSIPLKKCW